MKNNKYNLTWLYILIFTLLFYAFVRWNNYKKIEAKQTTIQSGERR